MTRLKPAAWSAHDAAPPLSLLSFLAPRPARDVAAAALRLASGALATLASRVAVQTPGVPEPQLATLEFYADAAAPEGALYADGVLVGWLEGVKRL